MISSQKRVLTFKWASLRKLVLQMFLFTFAPGSITEYLSDNWFELFDYTVAKGKDLEGGCLDL